MRSMTPAAEYIAYEQAQKIRGNCLANLKHNDDAHFKHDKQTNERTDSTLLYTK